VFDLAARQWVGTPGPSPSASVSPMPSVSPLPTSTPPPVATMLRTMIPGTPAPTRVYIVTTPEYEPTRGLGDPNSESAFDTRVAENYAAHGTALALTPSSTPGSPTATYTTAPTATEFIGWLSCGSMENSYVTQYDSCWQLLMNGHVYRVTSGREGVDNIGQGLITISELGPDNRFHDIGTYLTPSEQGSIEIAAIDGTRVYLVQSQVYQPLDATVTPTPNFVFVFDLATDQWVSP
jgi:hypothetical protein